MHAYYLSLLLNTSWEINCLASVTIRSTDVGVNTLLMSEKLNLALFFLNDHNIQYTKSWLEIAMYLFAYLAYANIWMQENMIEVKYRVTLLSAAFVHSVMPFCTPVTDSRFSQQCLNNRSELILWVISLSGYEGSSVVPYTLYHFHGAV